MIESYERSEKALLTDMMEVVVQGVSTRKVSIIVEELCGVNFFRLSLEADCMVFDEITKDYGNREKIFKK